MQKSFNSTMLRKMILAGATLLEDNKSFVDSLNVFPVPDGDTGTNMSMTFRSASNEVNNCTENSFAAISDALGRGALKGARGNSGVILSQIMKGMANVFATVKDEVNCKTFAKALGEGTRVAYQAVTKPKEGTILTVIRGMSEAAVKIAKKTSDIEEFLDQVIAEGEVVLQQTPELLPVLKKAGVVDAGGRGLIIIFTGFYKALIGEEDFQIDVNEMVGTVSVADNNDFYINLDNLADIKFAYCTEFMITHMKMKTTLSDIDKLRDNLCAIGDSCICIGDLDLVKVHVHTNEPNKALGYALELGELINLKIENMLEQNREVKKKRAQAEENLKPFGMIAVAPGDGIAKLFSELGVDECIRGGQTMNPSANDIATAVDKVLAKEVFVLPNNKNIILAAEQAKDLTKKTIHVIPTRSIPEGVASALAFNPDFSADENIESMTSSKDNVISSSVTYAVRSTHMDGIDLNEGDIIGLDDKTIITKGTNVSDTTVDLIKKIKTENVVSITLFYGVDVAESDANALRDRIQELYPDCDVTLLSGGQPVYYYIISME